MRICSLTPKTRKSLEDIEYQNLILEEFAHDLMAEGAMIHGPEHPNTLKWTIEWPRKKRPR